MAFVMKAFCDYFKKQLLSAEIVLKNVIYDKSYSDAFVNSRNLSRYHYMVFPNKTKYAN